MQHKATYGATESPTVRCLYWQPQVVYGTTECSLYTAWCWFVVESRRRVAVAHGATESPTVHRLCPSDLYVYRQTLLDPSDLYLETD
jgi:hypothetical protein